MDIDHPQDVAGIARLDAEAAGPSGQAAPQQRRKGVDPTVDGKAAPWVEKYRPKTLDDVAAHKEIIDTSEDAQGGGLGAPRRRGAARPLPPPRSCLRPVWLPPRRRNAATPPPPPSPAPRPSSPPHDRKPAAAPAAVRPPRHR
jgi:hypothetical protein